jgi:hypothetical protein
VRRRDICADRTPWCEISTRARWSPPDVERGQCGCRAEGDVRPVSRRFLLTMTRRQVICPAPLYRGGRSFWRTSAGFIDWECRSHAACPYVAASERQASVCARAICNSATARIDLPASEVRYARSNGDHPKNPANMAGISASRSAELCPMSFSRLRCASIVARSRPPS